MEDTIENITNGYYFFSIPKIFYINLENKDYLTYLYKEGESLYFAQTKKIVKLDDLLNLSYKKENSMMIIDSYKYNFTYTIIIAIPNIEKLSRLYIVSKYLNLDKGGEYLLPAEIIKRTY